MLPDVASPPEAADHPYAPRPFRVVERRLETADTATLVLRPIGPTPAPPFRPGQFNMVYAFGIGEAAISVSGPARPDGPERVHTVRAVGKVTQALFGATPGAVIGLRGPYGTPWPLDAAVGQDVVVVAGGLGLAPLRPLILELLAHRDRYQRVEIVCGARNPGEILYQPEVQAWRSRTDARIQVTVDTAGRDWFGDVGLVTARLPDARFDPARSVAFACGPEIMMRKTAEALVARGLAPERIFLSMERNMKCAFAQCGHCQLGPAFVCRDGPVFDYARLAPMFAVREL